MRRRRAPFAAFDKTLEARRREADEFYRACTPESAATTPRTSCGRPSAACSGRSSTTSSTSTCGCASTASIRSTRSRTAHVRNRQWFHMFNDDVISMPDKWEYPWYAAWDLAFHAVGAGAGRSGFRQASAHADAEGALSAFQRAVAGLRVELRRRQPAGACLGDALSIPHRAGDARRRATSSS